MGEHSAHYVQALNILVQGGAVNACVAWETTGSFNP